MKRESQKHFCSNYYTYMCILLVMIKYDGYKCPSKDHNKLNKDSHANILLKPVPYHSSMHQAFWLIHGQHPSDLFVTFIKFHKSISFKNASTFFVKNYSWPVFYFINPYNSNMHQNPYLDASGILVYSWCSG